MAPGTALCLPCRRRKAGAPTPTSRPEAECAAGQRERTAAWLQPASQPRRLFRLPLSAVSAQVGREGMRGGYAHSSQEVADGLGDGLGRFHLQQVGDAGEVGVDAVGEPLVQEVSALGEEGAAVRSKDREDRTCNRGGSVGIEAPRCGYGELAFEEGGCVPLGLFDATGDGAVDRLAPVVAPDQGEKLVHGAGMVLEEHQRSDPGGMADTELERDDRSERVPDGVNAAHAEMVEHGNGVVGLGLDRDPNQGMGAPGEAPPVEVELLEALQSGLVEQRCHGVRDVGAVYQEHRLSVSSNFVARRLAEVGDEVWREVLATYDEMVRAHLNRFAGKEVKHLGDGFLAAFDGPARAIRCALGILDGSNRVGIDARIGIHTGECEEVDGDLRGIAVHMSSRLVDLANPGEILASGTVRDLVAGSGIRFGDPRDVELNGVSGSKVVVPVLTQGAAPDTVRRLAVEQANVLRRDGEYWTVAFDGQVATVRDAKGLRDLARLLVAPLRELHVLDLAAERDAGVAPTSSPGSEGLARQGGGYDPVIDHAARAKYRQRLTELDADIDEADTRGDADASARARVERDALVDELTRAYGLGGTIRRSPDHVERARKTVSRRIRETISRMDRAHPMLGRHLHASAHTGVFCSYRPERDIAWTVDTSAGARATS
jgi:Adenylate and Guanylate cyclase catalytic domain